MTQESDAARLEIAALRAACGAAADEIDAHLKAMDQLAFALRRTRTAMSYFATQGAPKIAQVIPMKPGMTPRDDGGD